MPIDHTKPSLDSIQMLRAAAALLVLLHHTLPHYHAMGGSLGIIEAVSRWGFAGVDIFFIISGFIMAYTTFDKPRTLQSVKTFARHRLFRIYLGYWPFFFAMLLILYKKDPAHLGTLDIPGSFFLLQTDMFKLVLPVSWSLSYELYFYLLFAITLLLSLSTLYRIIPLVTISLLFLHLFMYRYGNMVDHFLYSPFLLEFFGGVMLYMYRKFLLRTPWLLLLIPLIFTAYSTGIIEETRNGFLRIATFGTGALGIVWSALILERNLRFTPPKLLVSLGNASYTLYLFHLVFLELFYYVGLRNLFTAEHTQLLPLLGLLAILFLCILISIIYYRVVEKPLYTFAVKHT